MGWQKIDDQFGVSRKVIRIPKRQRFAAIGLWTLAGNYASRALTDGVLEEHELEELGAPKALIDELVSAELWHAHGHQCAACIPVAVGSIVIHDYLHYNPARAKVLADRESERVRKASQRDKRRTPTGTPAGSDPVSGQPVPSRPDPVPIDVTYDYESSHLTDAKATDSDPNPLQQRAQKAGINDLKATRAILERTTGQPVSPRGAVELAEAIVSRAAKHVLDVDAYVATVCRNSPHEVQKAYFDLDIGGYAA